MTIENIERHLQHGHGRSRRRSRSARGEIGGAALVSTLCICIVFVPMFFLSGVARFLFVPLAEAVVFAMLASYLLSRTLVPTLVMLLMGGVHGQQAPTSARPSALQRVYRAFDRRFERVRRAYTLLLSALLSRRGSFMPRSSSASACCPACSIRRWAATSSRPWTPARSGCTCARPPAPASRKPRA